MTRFLKIFAAVAVCSAGLPVFADTAERLSSLSRSKFLAEYEARYVDSLKVQQELLDRLSLELSADIDTGPVTAEESASFACIYDAMDALGEIDQLAKQISVYERIRDRMNADPDFDMVTMAFAESEVEGFTDEITDEVLSAMSDCGSVSLASSRLNATGEFWAQLGAVAQERGYLD